MHLVSMITPAFAALYAACAAVAHIPAMDAVLVIEAVWCSESAALARR